MKKLSFSNVNTIYNFLSVLEENLQFINVLSIDIYQRHLQALLTLDEERQQAIVGFIHYVDELFSTDYHPFIRQKLATILSAASYYHDFYQQVSDLSFGELSILASFSSFDSVEVYSEYLEMYPKSVLNTIENKTGDFMVRNDLMGFVSFSADRGVSREEVFEQLRVQPLPVLRRQSNVWQLDIVGGDSAYDSRGVQL